MQGVTVNFYIVTTAAIFLSLASYVYFGNVFTAKQVFMVTAYLSHLYQSMLLFWSIALTSVAEAYVSVKRIQNFLLTPEEKQMSSVISDGDKEDDTLLTRKLTHGSNMIMNKLMPQKRISRTLSGNTIGTKGISFDNATALWNGVDNSTAGEVLSE